MRGKHPGAPGQETKSPVPQQRAILDLAETWSRQTVMT
jgi:hypothetical protein